MVTVYSSLTSSVLCQAWKIQSATPHTTGSAELHLNEPEKRNQHTYWKVSGGSQNQDQSHQMQLQSNQYRKLIGFEFGWSIGGHWNRKTKMKIYVTC